MPMSEAAMDGITANGHRWKHRITLSDITKQLGALNDRRNEGGEEPKREETEPLVEEIVKRVRAFVAARYAHHNGEDSICIDLGTRADDLECVSDCEIEEINFAMNELYDSFDYWRILAS